MAITTTDNKLRFLSGLSTNLETVALQAGNVYVTTDEHIMYADLPNKDGTTVRYRLSDIVMVNTVSDLPAYPPEERATALYYVRNGNILCCYNSTVGANGAAGSWTQINSLPTLENIIKSSAVTYSAVTGGAEVAFALKDKNDTNVTPNFKLAIAGGDTTKVTTSGNKVVITAADTITNSTLGTAAGTGTNSVKINLTETTTGYNADGTAKTSASTTDGITLSNNGGVKITQANKEIKLEATPTGVTPAFASDGKFTVKLTMPDGDEVTSTAITPQIKYGVNSGSKVTAKFVNGTADLSSIYTSAEVDAKITEKLQAANAMVFKGSVSPTVNLPYYASSDVSIGDTYIVNTEGTIKDANATTVKTGAKVGDLFIANAASETNGKITTAIEWIYVPAGNDDLYTYTADVSDTAFSIKQHYGGEESAIGTVTIGEGLTGAATNSNLTIKHPTKTVTTSTPTGTVSGTENLTFNAISAITYDTYGHIATVATSSYTIKNYLISKNEYTVSADATSATITNTITQASRDSEAASFKITSSNLSIGANAANKTISIDLNWGSF